MNKKLMLIILDGFGEGKPEPTNAIFAAKTPFIDLLKNKYPWTTLEPGGAEVGLLNGQTGSSDVGHNTIGSGQVVRQPAKIIADAITDNTFFKNKELLAAIQHAKQNNSNLHLFGIGADSYVHALLDYLYALLNLCHREKFPGNKVLLHLAADGRDNPPHSGIDFFQKIQKQCDQYKVGKIASMFGRILLDRGQNWERTEKVYDLLTDPNQKFTKDWHNYFDQSYQKGTSDEMLGPIALGDEAGIYPRIKSNDAIINFNYRADRERQITAALSGVDFNEFTRKQKLENIYYVGFISYSPLLKSAHAAFSEEHATICLSEILEKNNFKHLHISGQEKFIFVTYNFNKAENLNLAHETDVKAPQTHEVETFDKNPEMSAPNLTKSLMKELNKDEQDVYIINYENCDQVGHTGDLHAAIQAVEAVDKSLSQVIPLAQEKGFQVIITADHGNADIMVDENGNPHTAHTHNKVPFLVISPQENIKLRSDGTLADVSPTVLTLLDLPVPSAMTGKNLII